MPTVKFIFRLEPKKIIYSVTACRTEGFLEHNLFDVNGLNHIFFLT